METTIEERVGALEAQIAQLLKNKDSADPKIPWWQQHYGAFKDDEMYDSAMRLGEEYRRSQPTASEEIEALEKAGIYVPQHIR